MFEIPPNPHSRTFLDTVCYTYQKFLNNIIHMSPLILSYHLFKKRIDFIPFDEGLATRNTGHYVCGAEHKTFTFFFNLVLSK